MDDDPVAAGLALYVVRIVVGPPLSFASVEVCAGEDGEDGQTPAEGSGDEGAGEVLQADLAPGV